MRPPLPVVLALLTAALAGCVGARGTTGPGAATPAGPPPPYEVGLFGDMPYGEAGRAAFPAVRADMNAHRLAFSIFDGDTKNGSEPCYADGDGSAAAAHRPDVYRYALSLFAGFRDPVVYLPGDNEWSDCDRPALHPAFSATGRLAYLRRLSYPTDRSLGQRTIALLRQSAAYPENVRWVAGPVTYVGLNLPGGDNGVAVSSGVEGPVAPSLAEYAGRNRANLAWLAEGFAAARREGSAAVLVALQADMWAGPPERLRHYADTKRVLAELAASFRRPVLVVNGDSHVFRIDAPLAGADGQVVPNVTRLTTFGAASGGWVSATVDVRDPKVFALTPHPIPPVGPRRRPLPPAR